MEVARYEDGDEGVEGTMDNLLKQTPQALPRGWFRSQHYFL